MNNIDNSIKQLQQQVNEINTHVQAQQSVQVMSVNPDEVRPEIKYAVPKRDGFLPLIDMFEPIVRQIKKEFNLTANINDIWVHINRKMLADVPTEDIEYISPFNVVEYLYNCIDNNLNPLKTEIATYYDAKKKSIKTQILLEGYNKIYAQNPLSNGVDYEFGPVVDTEFVLTTWEWDPQKRKKVANSKTVVRPCPTSVKCKVYRKDMEHPTVAFAFIDDIGTTGAWQGHPQQMMCNRAFTRAVRMAYNLEGTSSEDVAEIKQQNYVQENQVNTQQDAAFDADTTVIINGMEQCKSFKDLKELFTKHRTTVDNMPDQYRQRILLKLNEMSAKLKAVEQQSAVQPQVQSQPQPQTVQQNVTEESCTNNDLAKLDEADNQPAPIESNISNEEMIDNFDFEQQIS